MLDCLEFYILFGFALLFPLEYGFGFGLGGFRVFEYEGWLTVFGLFLLAWLGCWAGSDSIKGASVVFFLLNAELFG